MKTVKRIIEAVMAVSFVFLVSFSFTHSNTTVTILRKVLKLKVEPAMIGGEVMTRYFDKRGDDNGSGKLSYPRNEIWNEDGLLDLLVYTVHYPVSRADKLMWWDSYWQLDFTFETLPNPLEGQAGFSFPVIHVYIDVDGKQGGSVETRQSRSELVSFSSEYPWDYMLHIDGFSSSGMLYSADGSYEALVWVIPDHANNRIMARLPLEKDGLMDVLTLKETRHYVLVGAYDMAARGNFMNVAKQAGRTRGGGADNRNTPRVYDYLPPAGSTQAELLSAYNSDGNAYARLEPVAAGPDSTSGTVLSDDQLEKLRLAAEAETAEMVPEKRTISDIEKGEGETAEKLLAYLENGYYDEAKKIMDDMLAEDPENAGILCYYGSLTAMEGGKAGDLGESVRLVNRAFEIYEQAEDIMTKKGTEGEDKLDLLLNRGSVALSIPEAVFGKSLQGAADFLEAADIFLEMDDSHGRQAADSFYQAGRCYGNAGKPEKAEVAYIEALSLPEVSARIKYELAVKGIITQ